MEQAHTCPECGNSNDERMVYSAKGHKIICLDCYMSWPNDYKKRKYRPRHSVPAGERKERKPVSYVQLWRENKRLQLENNELRFKLQQVRARA
jgi:hypothetical protein